VQIGLISHVGYLKEQIPAQIAVEPVTSGRSRIRAAPAASDRSSAAA
jgi:DNA repair exonuclease SbcCD ATPase subunit